MPTVTPLLDQCGDNLATWKGLAEERKAEKEREKEKEGAEEK